MKINLANIPAASKIAKSNPHLFVWADIFHDAYNLRKVRGIASGKWRYLGERTTALLAEYSPDALEKLSQYCDEIGCLVLDIDARSTYLWRREVAKDNIQYFIIDKYQQEEFNFVLRE